MTARWMGIWLAAGMLYVPAARGETLHQSDGITLEGRVRVETRDAGVCQVAADQHPAGEYERMKANHGQPLHVWRMDFSVRNDSGRRLEHLVASFSIASEAPPCTSWSGPLGNYAKPVQWANSFQVLQEPDGMEHEEEASGTVFMLVFHDRRPEFEHWNVDYRFANEAGGEAEPAVVAPAFIVVAVPAHAMVSLLNTAQPYRRRMPLEPGMYQVEVSAPGYRTHRVWVDHKQTWPHRIELERLPIGDDRPTPPALGAARGQQLLEIDGIELRGEAQLAQSGGGSCNVIESDTSYAARKENHGAPMDVWRLDFTVRNGSGRWLDHLIARFQIESQWPECTNWDVPDQSQFPQTIEWADSIGHIQESGRNVVSPDQTLTVTKYFIVLRGDPEPRFSNWSMDFDFATAPPSADSATASGASSAPAQTVSATAEQENLFWQSIMNSANPAEFEAYLMQFPNGVFRALAQARLAALRVPGSAPSPVDAPRVGPTTGAAADVRPPTRRESVDFGDDTSAWARDGECDDPRFEGPGMAAHSVEENLGRDATDCRRLFESGQLSVRDIDVEAPSTIPAAAGRAHLLVWSAEPSDEHNRIHIYIDGEWQVNRDVWYTWRGPPPDCNYRENHPDGVPELRELLLGARAVQASRCRSSQWPIQL